MKDTITFTNMKYIITELQYNNSINKFMTYLLEPHEEKRTKIYPNSIFWFKDGEVIAEIEKSKYFWVSPRIWGAIESMLYFHKIETEQVIKHWLEEHYKLGGLKPIYGSSGLENLFEELGNHDDNTELTLTESLEDEFIDNYLKKYIDSGCVKIRKTPNYISVDVESPSYFNEFGFDRNDPDKIKNLLKKHSFQYSFGEYIKKI